MSRLTTFLLLATALLFLLAVSGHAQTGRPSVADVFANRDMSDPVQRAEAVEEIRAIQEARKAAAVAMAQERGLPTRIERADGTVQEVVEIDEAGELLYFTTHNLNAAISTGADRLRTVNGLTGSGLVIGMWDGGSGRSTHQEFAGGRMLVKDGSPSIDHATHVGGTMIASGVQTSARGMAVSAVVDTYDWDSDLTEMTGRAAASPGQAGRIPISNHSYGYIRGWNWDGQRWVWTGSGTTASAIETNFGRYNARTRDLDSLAFNNPYYLMFWSAGNERSNNPSTGSTVSIGGNLVTYDPALHPPGDGVYRGGFETIADNAVAKNVIVVGAVTDAVTGGSRDVTKANPTSFTSYGPTDDGRIKPDLVANGDGLYSSWNSSDTSYATISGTSMASPNAAGTAALLVQHYGNLFPGGAMRSSTLKGLLIHTADDRGHPGPDYKFGWGLVNGEAAAALLTDHANNPSKIRLNEGRISTSNTVISHQFTWDGVSPIRATLSWTDPAGVATTTSDLRTARLVNNLNVKIVGPNGVEYFPYVMPFVGTWTQASMDLPATTGINNTDNVEQVYLAAPPVAGVYQAVVSYSGSLANNQQDYSLLISGSAVAFEEEPSSITPTTALSVLGVAIDIAGRPGFRDTPDNYTAWTSGTTGGNGFGAWTLTASGTAGHLLAEGPDYANMNVGSSKGFGLYASGGGSATATRDFNNTMEAGDTFMLKFDNNSIDNGGQVGFSLADSAGTTRLRFYFVGGEQFYRVTDSIAARQTSIPYTSGGLTVYVTLNASGGYTLYAGGSTFSGTLAAGGNIKRLVVQNNNAGPDTDRNLYLGEMTMTGDPLGASTDVRLVRAGRGDIVAGGAQLLDGVLRATFDLTGAAGGLWSVVATNADGSVLRFDDAFDITAIGPFQWSENFDGTVSGWTSTAVTGTNAWSLSAAQVHSAPNSYFAPGPNSKTTVRLTSAPIAVPVGAYDMQLRFWHSYNLQANRDGGRLEVSVDDGTTWFTVESTGSGVAFAQNGYNSTMESKGNPNAFSDFAGLAAWTGNSDGFVQTVLSITNSSKFAGRTVRFRWILATDSSTVSTGWYVDSIQFSGMAPAEQQAGEPPLITSEPRTATEEFEEVGDVIYEIVRDTETTVTVSATDDGGEANLRYTWSATGGTVIFSPNGNNAAKSATATFSSAGDYTLTVTVADGDGLTTSSSVPVRVKQTATSIDLDPASIAVAYGGTQLFTAQQRDQFGDSMVPQPSFSWSVSGGGTVSGSGLFTGGMAGGPYTVTATAGELSGTAQVSVTPATATVTLGNLSAVYNGGPQAASVTTTPSGLATSVTYNGSPSVPVNAGSYAVEATVTDPNYSGSASETLVIAPAEASVTLGGLSTTYDGSAQPVSVTTSPSGLTTSVTYNGSPSVPVNAGSYTVAATVTDPNYTGSASGTLDIAKASQTITFGALPAKSFGDAPFAAGATAISGLAVAYASSNGNVATVDGGTIRILGAGIATITATQSGDANYEAAAPVEQVLQVAPVTASVTLDNSRQTYDGEPKAVTVTTNPPGLAVSVIYDGSTTPPTEAGSYAVLAAISEANYTGSAEAVLEIAKATASVVIGSLEHPYDGQAKEVTVETVPAGLEVSVTYNGAELPPVEPGSYEVIATINEANYEGSADAIMVIALNETSGLTFATWQQANFGEGGVEGPDADPEADPDGDGVPNWAEFHLGTDPNDGNSRLEVAVDPPSGGRMAVTIAPVTRVGTFRLQTWTSLLESPELETLVITEQEERAGVAERDIDLSDGEDQILDKIFLRIVYEPPAP
jgi:hypothetical protein